MILENPLTAKVRAADRRAVVDRFHLAPDSADGRYLGLRRYLASIPERFFNRDVQSAYVDWLEARHARDPLGLRDYLKNHIDDFGRALLFLREINIEDWHDIQIGSINDWELLRFIDTRVHRTYLRLIEGVLTPLARIVAYFSRVDRNAGTEGLDIHSIAQEIANGPMAIVTGSYRSTVRNGIGHGGISYQQFQITYRDKRGNEEALAIHDVVRLCDDLVDDCNGLAAALALFMVLHRQDNYPVPEELLVEELREETVEPWWLIDGAIRSEIPAGSQLLIYAQARSRNFWRIQLSAIQSGILAESFAPGYDRYFLSIRGRPSGVGWAAFFGEPLRAHRTSGDDLTAYTDVLESIYFQPSRRWPGWMRRIDSLVQSFRMNWPAARRDWQASRGIPAILPRTAEMHANGWRSVMNGAVVFERPTPHDIRRHRWRIVHSASSIANAKLRRVGYYPLGFAQIAVFDRDYRTRRLSGFGLGADLVCTVRYQSIRRIRSPDIWGSTVEVTGPWRIAWNRAWLEREKVALGTPAPWQVEAPEGLVQ